MCFDFSLFDNSHWFFLFNSFLAVILLHAMNLTFAKIPIGGHTVCACVAASAVAVVISFLMRSSVNTIVPFEALFIGIHRFL